MHSTRRPRPLLLHAAFMLALSLGLVAPAAIAEPWFGLDLPAKRAAKSLKFRQAYSEPDIPPLSLRLSSSEDAYQAIRGEEIHAYLQDIVDLTVANRPAGARYWGRIAGSAAEIASADYLGERFREFGLEEVRSEPVIGGPQWWPHSWQVTLLGDPAYGEGTTDLALETAFPALQLGEGALAVDGLVGELIFVGRGHAIDLMDRDIKGKIAVVRSVLQSDPFFQSARGYIEGIIEAGAVGVITLLDTPGNNQFALERMGPPGVPCFVLGGDDGRFLEEAMVAAGIDSPLRVRLDIQAEVSESWQGKNIMGVVAGTTAENVVILAHLDGYFESANDNAGGMASLLALAKFFSDPSRNPPNRNLIFLGTSAHHEFSDGARSFVENHADILNDTLLAFNIEHPSSVMTDYRGPLKFERFVLPGQLMTSTSQGTRAWTVSNNNEVLKGIYREAIDRYGLVVNSMMERLPSGDAYDFFKAGTPVVQMLDSNSWFHSDGDLPDTVHAHGLERATRAYAYILEQIDATPSDEMIPKKQSGR